MTEFIITIDVPTDQPWHYRTTEDKVVEVLGAFATLGHTVINVAPTQEAS